MQTAKNDPPSGYGRTFPEPMHVVRIVCSQPIALQPGPFKVALEHEHFPASGCGRCSVATGVLGGGKELKRLLQSAICKGLSRGCQ
jgi:hypothetical protein